VYDYGSSLEDVVGSHPGILDLWKSNKVTNPCVVTALHIKYWGLGKKTMKEEEEEWKRAAMDVDNSDGDGDNDSNVGDTIGDGCYVLDIGLNGIEPSKIWVRMDYIFFHIYDELEI
jgi:hypothetical protein